MNDKKRSQCIATLRASIDTMQACIDACQTFADKCSTQDALECAVEVKKCKQSANANISACHQTELICKDALSDNTTDPEITNALSSILAHCKRIILSSQAIVHACEENKQDCNTITLEILPIAQEYSLLCDKTIKLLQHK